MSVKQQDLLLRCLAAQYGDEGSPFEFLGQYGPYRYHLLLEAEDSNQNGEELLLLQKLWAAVDEDDMEEADSITKECIMLFFPFVKADFATRLGDREQDQLDTQTQKLVKLKVRTNDQGVLEACAHQMDDLRTRNDPQSVPNTVTEARVFSAEQLTAKNPLDRKPGLFKVTIEESTYCLKTIKRVGPESLTKEMETLSKVPAHPNIISLAGVIDPGDGNVDGLLLPWIEGESLRSIDISEDDGAKWKQQITEAVEFLHSHDIIWGDVKADNIMIEKSGNAILHDFGGGFTKNWVDFQLAGTLKGDYQGLQSICDFIDKRVAGTWVDKR